MAFCITMGEYRVASGEIEGEEEGKGRITEEETSLPIAFSFAPTSSISPSGARRLAVK